VRASNPHSVSSCFSGKINSLGVAGVGVNLNVFRVFMFVLSFKVESILRSNVETFFRECLEKIVFFVEFL
jgi:hypothetical protein